MISLRTVFTSLTKVMLYVWFVGAVGCKRPPHYNLRVENQSSLTIVSVKVVVRTPSVNYEYGPMFGLKPWDAWETDIEALENRHYFTNRVVTVTMNLADGSSVEGYTTAYRDKDKLTVVMDAMKNVMLK